MKPLHFARAAMVLTVTTVLAAVPAMAATKAQSGSIKVTVEGMTAGKPIAEAQALCTPTADGKSEKVKAPLRPTIRWSGVPREAASVAVFVMDPDVPTVFDDAGKEGKVLPKDMKRMDFYHYGVVNLPATATELPGGDATKAPAQGHELLNDLGTAGYVNPKESYGGPCPPWNDERLHHYHFMVLALDNAAPVTMPTPRGAEEVGRNPNTAKATFDRLMKSGHVLAKGAVVGTYTLNAGLRSAAKP